MRITHFNVSEGNAQPALRLTHSGDRIAGMKTGERIRAIRKAKGLKISEVESRAGLSEGNLSRVERGHQWLSEEKLFALANALGVKVSDFFIPESDDYYNAGEALELKQGRYVAIVGTAQGGPDGYISICDFMPGDGDGYIYTYSSDPGAYGIRVRGDSMRPRIKSGEYIVAEPNVQALPGDDVVVRRTDGRALVKELLWIRDDEVSFGSINNGVPPITVPLAEIQSIHRVAAIVPRGSALLKPRT